MSHLRESPARMAFTLQDGHFVNRKDLHSGNTQKTFIDTFSYYLDTLTISKKERTVMSQPIIARCDTCYGILHERWIEISDTC